MVQPGEHEHPGEQIWLRPRFEAAARELRLACQQGDAFGSALAEMLTVGEGQEEHAGEWTVALIVLPAQGFYCLRDQQLVWQEPALQENAYLLVAPRDAQDGRFVPGLTVHVTIIAPDGHDLGTKVATFVWHPWLFHYGANWTVPGPGEYIVRVRLDAAAFPRHDRQRGRRYARSTEAIFTGVRIQPRAERETPPTVH